MAGPHRPRVRTPRTSGAIAAIGSTQPIAVALIEDNRLVREGITALLNQQPDIVVVSGRSADDVAALRPLQPQVVLLDIGLRTGDSLRIAAKVRAEFPEAKVIAMDLLPAHEDIVAFVNAGISGFIMKDATLEELVHTIRAVHGGANVLPTPMVSTLFSQIARDVVARGRPHLVGAVRMTPREREVITLIAHGLSNKDIAARLRVATHTVKSHVRNIMEKLTLRTRLQIAAYARGQASPESRTRVPPRVSGPRRSSQRTSAFG